MFNKCKALPLIITCILLATTAFADEVISLKVGYQLLSPEGKIASTANGVGTTADIEKDLNLSDSKKATAEIALKWNDSQFTLNYLPISCSGTGDITTDIIFNDSTFLDNAAIDTVLDIEIYDIGYTYYLLNFDDIPTRFQLGVELAVKVTNIDIRLQDHTNSLTESESVTATIPTIGLRSRIALADFIGISGRIGYTEYDNNSFVDAEAQIEFSPLPMVGIYAGYRYLDLQIDEGDLFIQTQLSGLFGGLLVRF